MRNTHAVNRRVSLNALRIFALVAERRSIAGAAAELGVTPSAVSHQIRALEDVLGVALLRRRGNMIDLTPAGLRLNETCGPAIAMAESAAASLMRDADEVAVRAPISLAVRWLIPRLEDFKRTRPAARIRVETSHYEQPGIGATADLAISYERGDGVADDPIEILADIRRPLLSPRLAGGSGRLAELPLIAASEDGWEWRAWAGLSGSTIAGTFAHVFDTEDAAIHAAVAGLGVVLASPALAARELSSGVLVPFPGAEEARLGRYVVVRGRDDRRLVAALAAWLARPDPRHLPGELTADGRPGTPAPVS